VRFRAFEQAMKKDVFTFREAALVGHREPLAALRLNLHRWVKNGYLLRLRREVYAFPRRPLPAPALISALYPPAYISLESALNQQGFLPDVPFETTLVTPRATRTFQTPAGRFHFHRIQKKLFFGYDPATLLAEPEKALLDYFYLRGSSMKDVPAFWEESRFQNLERLDWRKGDREAALYPAGRVQKLWKGLKRYAKTHHTA